MHDYVIKLISEEACEKCLYNIIKMFTLEVTDLLLPNIL